MELIGIVHFWIWCLANSTNKSTNPDHEPENIPPGMWYFIKKKGIDLLREEEQMSLSLKMTSILTEQMIKKTNLPLIQ